VGADVRADEGVLDASAGLDAEALATASSATGAARRGVSVAEVPPVVAAAVAPSSASTRRATPIQNADELRG
jgi:hypothetical protein